MFGCCFLHIHYETIYPQYLQHYRYQQMPEDLTGTITVEGTKELGNKGPVKQKVTVLSCTSVDKNDSDEFKEAIQSGRVYLCTDEQKMLQPFLMGDERPYIVEVRIIYRGSVMSFYYILHL